MLLTFQSLLKKIEKNPDSLKIKEVKNAIVEAEEETKKLTKIVTNLLDISTIRSGGFKLEKKRFNLTKLITEVVAKFKKQYPAISLKTQRNIYLTGDILRIEQLLNNLISNSIKYGRGKPIRITARKLKKYVKITVSDDGIGIRKKHLEQIFEKFERAVANQHLTGFGMGLYIARKIVESHGGRISVTSKLNDGSTFQIILPTT